MELVFWEILFRKFFCNFETLGCLIAVLCFSELFHQWGKYCEIYEVFAHLIIEIGHGKS